jgi:hypothetical protein
MKARERLPLFGGQNRAALSGRLLLRASSKPPQKLVVLLAVARPVWLRQRVLVALADDGV